ncbi:SCRB7.2 family protein [Megaselia abdita]
MYSLKHSLEKKRNINTQIIGMILTSCLLLLITIFLLAFDLLKLVTLERMQMREGLPFFEIWKNPPDPIYTKVYVFNYTNVDRFLSGEDSKLEFEEIGPVVYYKYPHQRNITFNENSTLSYTTTYDIVFPEDKNIPGILNKTVIVPNVLVLTLASLVHEKINSIFTRAAVNMIISKESIFINASVYDFLWNMQSPTVELLKPFIPSSLFPRTNAGLLYSYFYPEQLDFNVNIGTKHGAENFFKVNTLNNDPFIIGYKDYEYESCPQYGIVGATETTGIQPNITKDSIIKPYSFMLPRAFDTFLAKQYQRGILDIYEFQFHDQNYRRLNSSQRHCLGKTGSVYLPDGLIDSSKIVYGVPFALSPPHFLGFTGPWEEYLGEFAPDPEKHISSMVLEAVTGFQLKVEASLQLNLILPEYRLNPRINQLGGKILPLAWMNYKYEFDSNLTIMTFIHFAVCLPTIQIALIGVLIAALVYKLYNLYKLIKMKGVHEIKFGDSSLEDNNIQDEEKEIL